MLYQYILKVVEKNTPHKKVKTCYNNEGGKELVNPKKILTYSQAL